MRKSDFISRFHHQSKRKSIQIPGILHIMKRNTSRKCSKPNCPNFPQGEFISTGFCGKHQKLPKGYSANSIDISKLIGGQEEFDGEEEAMMKHHEASLDAWEREQTAKYHKRIKALPEPEISKGSSDALQQYLFAENLAMDHPFYSGSGSPMVFVGAIFDGEEDSKELSYTEDTLDDMTDFLEGYEEEKPTQVAIYEAEPDEDGFGAGKLLWFEDYDSYNPRDLKAALTPPEHVSLKEFDWITENRGVMWQPGCHKLAELDGIENPRTSKGEIAFKDGTVRVKIPGDNGSSYIPISLLNPDEDRIL